MRKLMITGNIVADAKKEVSSTGTERITFRIGNNDYSSQKDNDGKPITYWFSVTSFNPRAIGLLKYLKKGKFVSIIGDYEDNIYQNKNTGNCEIGRNIVADSINFVDNRSPESNGNTSNTSSATDFAKVTNKPTNTPKPEPKASVEVVTDDNDDDGLPF